MQSLANLVRKKSEPGANDASMFGAFVHTCASSRSFELLGAISTMLLGVPWCEVVLAVYLSQLLAFELPLQCRG